MLFMSNMSQETPVKSQPKAELGRRIRHYRERTGLNQTDIERVTGVRRDYLSSIEGGRIRVIYPANFNALHKVLRFPGWEILELDGLRDRCWRQRPCAGARACGQAVDARPATRPW